MTKRNKKKKVVSKIFMAILMLINILFITLTFMLNVIPIKFMIVVIVVLVLIDLLAIKLMFSRRNYKRMIGLVISSVLSLIMIFGSVYEIATLGFFGNFNKYNYKTLNYKVLVLKNSNYEDIKELKNKDIGILKDENIKLTVENLKKVIKFNAVKNDDITELIEKLLNEEIEALIIEEAKYTILAEDNSELQKNIKELYTLSYDIQLESIDKSVDVTKEPFNIYISGIDSYGKITSVSRSDVNIIATVNPKTNEIVLTSIPRDYYVQLHDTTGYKDKLTHAGVYGVEKSVATLEDLFDIEINYYVKVNFTSLIKIVDELDGITVNSNYSFSSDDNKYHYKEGINELNGREALAFVRERKAFKDGDRVRGENQQLVLEAIINKALSPKIITKYNGLLKSLEDSFVTNMEDNDITSLIKRQLNNNKSWDFSTINLEGTDAYDYTYTHSASKLYVMVPDEESVNAAKLKLHEILD